MKWEAGRQGSGYEKLTIFMSKMLMCDCYILRFRPGSYIDWHTDPLPKPLAHWRLNIFLRKAKEGGVFETKLVPRIDWPRLQLFRPDINPHRVTEIKAGTRYVLSIGWAKIDL